MARRLLSWATVTIDFEFFSRAELPHAQPAMIGLLNRVMGELVEMPEDQMYATTLKYLGGWETDKIAGELGIGEEQAAELAISGLKSLKEADVLRGLGY